MSPKITIITPTYNSENLIGNTIEALINQSFSDFEYIVIDGKSTDGTLAKITSYLPLFHQKGVNVTVVSEKDKGVYDAMNKGIALAKGTLIGITNSDDWYEPNALELMWQQYTSISDDMRDNTIYYGIERQWKDNKVYQVHRRGADFVSEGTLPHATFFVPKIVYNKYGVFDLSIRVLADYDFYSRCYTKGCQLYGIDAVISNFRLGGLSSSFFDYYTDFHSIQLKYGFISKKYYRNKALVLKTKKMLNSVLNWW